MSHLLEPLTVGTLRLHNRLVLPPMATLKATPDGRMSDELLGYYAEKTRGGAIGLAITEHSFITKAGQNRPGQPSVADDDTIEGWRALADLFHANGSACAVQINHVGASATSATTGMDVVAPSDVTSPTATGENSPRPLTVDEIHVIVGEFAAAAARVKTAGFDAVEIHAAHGYLLCQFLSPITNRRTDDYGGPLSNRFRLHLEVIAAVREAVGGDFPVLMRLGASDYLDGGTTIEDAMILAAEIERAGVRIIDVTGGLTGYVRPGHTEPGYLAELSEAVKSVVSVPVVLTGGVTEAHQAETLLAEGKADLIGVGRAMLKDPGWAQRAVQSLQE